MYTDRNALDEYAYHGVFYRSEQKPKEDGDLIGNDGDMLGDTDTSAGESESENVETIIFETDCDIQETNKLFNSGVVTLGYTIYFPMPTKEGEDGKEEEYIPEGLNAGIRFRGKMYGMDVDGMVIGVYPTQMHGCVAYIKGTDI